ncbi:type II toxin-antitoxin system RelE/ParE family toxin [Patescibacteria group bacterium]|nr:type II toxin-antitoxin system RelE/ParE family toxin [Patescibacteria group bacterium]
MEWKILEFGTLGGERPVAEFIKSQPAQVIAKIVHLIDLLEIHGNLLSMPHAKKLQINLYELRIRGQQEIRIVYGFVGKTIYLVSAFKKQKQKTPKKEIETAKTRLANLT